MKPLTMMTWVGAAGVAILGVMMVKTNPSQGEYEKYAVQKLTTYLESDVCKKTPSFLEKLIKVDCQQMLESAIPHIKELITTTTNRQDYMILSIFRTEIKLDSRIPGYKLETLGVLNQFYTYTAEQK